MSKPRLEPQFVIDELTAICNSLGKIDENDGTYMKDRDCKACLRDLLRYLNADSDNHVARSTLGSLNIVKNDLIPLMNQYCDFTEGDPELFTAILRICSNLTSSILLLFQENPDKPQETDNLPLKNKLLNSLYGYKEAFATNDKIWTTLNIHLRHNTEDEVTFERLIILIRNILHIPVDSSDDLGVHKDFDTHEMCLYRMEKSGMLHTILEIASQTQRGAEFCFHLTEIIYLMLRDQNPETLAHTKSEYFKKQLDETDVDRKRYLELSARDRRQREANRILPSACRFRHSAFQANNLRSIADKPLIMTKPLVSREAVKFDHGKDYLRKPKNKAPMSSETSIMISDQNTRSSKVSFGLKIFCKKFVEQVYNNYMQQIKHNLIQKRAQAEDESYYLWAIQFFTSFSRHMKMSIDHVSETLSTSSLHFIQILINTYQEKIDIEKKKFHDVSKRLHLALRAYREILLLIKSIDKESQFAQTVESIQRNIFSETEYSTILLSLFQHYSEPRHSEHYLRDLIQTNNEFLEIYEDFAKNHAPTWDESEEDSSRKKKKKVELKTAQFMTRYCCPDVIRVHVKVLKLFQTNEDATNLAILRFLERIVYDCKNETILFQASLFRCLLAIYDYDPSMPGHERFKALCKHLTEQFGIAANKRRWMFQEILFWKTFNDVSEIENAINPPPAIPPNDPLEEADNPVFDNSEAQQPDEEPEVDKIAELKAELEFSDDDENDDDDDKDDDKDDDDSFGVDLVAEPLPELDEDEDEELELDRPLVESDDGEQQPVPAVESNSSLD